MSSTYKIPKGTKVKPFTFVYDVDFAQNHGWRVISPTRTPQLCTVEDWYFTDDDILPYDYDIWKKFYIRLSVMSDEGNAFEVRRDDVLRRIG